MLRIPFESTFLVVLMLFFVEMLIANTCNGYGVCNALKPKYVFTSLLKATNNWYGLVLVVGHTWINNFWLEH